MTVTAMVTAIGKAHGKLILLGEHAVVYGVPAVVCGLTRELTAEARPAPDGEGSGLRLLSRTVRLEDDGEPLARAFDALLGAAGGRAGLPDAVRVEVRGDLPPGMGLGFSAAASVAAARAIEVLARGEEDDDAVRERATAWERVFHGNPSGVDVAAAMHGGFVRFRRGEGVRPLRAERGLRLCVGLTGAPASTRVMVENVAAQRERDPEAFQKSLEGIASLVERASSAIAEGELEAIGELMDQNQRVLAGWMLSTPAIESLCGAAREAGALGAKLTGSGGGGAVVALAGDAGDERAAAIAARVIARWRELGYEGFEVAVGG